MRQPDVVIPAHCLTSAAFLMPVPHEFLSAPLDCIAAEYARQRCVCAYLRQMAREKRAAHSDATAVIVFLTEDLQRHHDDEDFDLFPALRRRAAREDALDVILEPLAHDHASIGQLAGTVVSAITRDLDNARARSAVLAICKAGCEAMTSFAASLLQHLSVENAIALVFARKRLAACDLAAISHRMTARRGGSARV